jgi:hypothetical protein
MEAILGETGTTLADWALVATAIAAVLIAAAVPASAYLRRPDLRLTETNVANESHVESDGLAYLRLVVENGPRKRAAHRARVMVEGYRRQGEPEASLRRLTHPSLGWSSAVEAKSDETAAAVTVHSGSGRPIDLGRFIRAVRSPEGRLGRGADGNIAHFASGDPNASWHLMLGLHDLSLNDDRDKLPAGAWIVRLLVGADDGDAHRYDVHVTWSESRPDSQAVLDEAIEHLAIESV